MVSEGAIIGMLLYCHQLYCVVTQSLYPGEHIFGKLAEGASALLLCCHAHMGLINENRFWRRRRRVLHHVSILRMPYLCGKDLSHLILHSTGYIGRDPFTVPSLPPDNHLVEITV